MKKPIIGITLDYEKEGEYSKFPWYAIRENYLTSLHKFGAIPIPLLHQNSAIESLIDILDGLIITGGKGSPCNIPGVSNILDFKKYYDFLIKFARK